MSAPPAGPTGGAAGAAKGAGAKVASLDGRVRFRGELPAAVAAPLDADPYCAARHEGPLRIATVEVSEDGGLRGAVVYLRDAPASSDADEFPEAVLEQRDCLYQPSVLAVRVGQTVVFRNDDQTLHNVHVEPSVNAAFNLGQPFQGVVARRRFAQAEVGIAVRCDVHPWMRATISVFDHPYFATTDRQGRFSMPAPPPGSYTLEAWHETLGTASGRVDVGVGGATIDLVFE